MAVFEIQGYFSLAVLLVMLAVKGYAFVSALSFSEEAYRASGKQHKTGWSIGLGVGLAAQVILMSSAMIVHLAFLIVALVYLTDVRPALSQVVGKRR